jgi:hypothetical protein
MSICHTLENLTASDWAAWAQAVGSIGAIIAAFLVGRQQAKAAIAAVVEAHTLQETGRLKSILAIGEAAFDRAKRIGEAISRHETDPVAIYNVYDPTVINSMAAALTSVPAHEIGSRDAVIAILDLRDQIRFLGESVETFKNPQVDLDTAKMLPTLEPAEVRNVLKQRKMVLAGNVTKRVDRIGELYAMLDRAIHRSIDSAGG